MSPFPLNIRQYKDGCSCLNTHQGMLNSAKNNVFKNTLWKIKDIMHACCQISWSRIVVSIVYFFYNGKYGNGKYGHGHHNYEGIQKASVKEDACILTGIAGACRPHAYTSKLIFECEYSKIDFISWWSGFNF